MTRKAVKNNVWSSPYLQRCLVWDNGHLLVQVPKRSGIPVNRIVHKELGIISRTKCCWNSLKEDVLFSVQRLHCPEVFSRAKDMENCRFTTVPTRPRLRLFFAKLSLPIISVFTEQSQTCEEYESLHDRSGQFDVVMGTINCPQ